VRSTRPTRHPYHSACFAKELSTTVVTIELPSGGLISRNSTIAGLSLAAFASVRGSEFHSAHTGVAAADSTWRAHAVAAESAYAAHDFAAYRAQLGELYVLLSGNPRVVYSLARAEARLGHPDSALRWLGVYAAMGLVRDVQSDSDLATVRTLSGFARIADRLAANARPVTHSVRTVALANPELLAEDVSYDAHGDRFFVSSVHDGTITIVPRSGQPTDQLVFARGPPGWGLFAIAVDATRHLLWATAAAVPHAAGYQPADSGQSATLLYDLRSGNLIRRYPLPADGRPHALGDMTLGPSGVAYVSDGRSGGVYRLRPTDDHVETIIEPGTALTSPQTPVLAPDGQRLFVPDYLGGIAVVDLATRRVDWLPHPADVALNGIDGLYLSGRTMLAVQNGTHPERVIRLKLDAGLRHVESWDLIEANWPGLGDPTHGVIVGTDFYYISNSGWDRWNDDGSHVAGVPITSPVLMRTTVAAQ
jgi:hypothetical protein